MRLPSPRWYVSSPRKPPVSTSVRIAPARSASTKPVRNTSARGCPSTSSARLPKIVSAAAFHPVTMKRSSLVTTASVTVARKRSRKPACASALRRSVTSTMASNDAGRLRNVTGNEVTSASNIDPSFFRCLANPRGSSGTARWLMLRARNSSREYPYWRCAAWLLATISRSAWIHMGWPFSSKSRRRSACACDHPFSTTTVLSPIEARGAAEFRLSAR